MRVPRKSPRSAPPPDPLSCRASARSPRSIDATPSSRNSHCRSKRVQLTEHHNENQFFVRRADEKSVTVIDRTLDKSFIIAPNRIVEEFPYADSKTLDKSAVDKILELKPEVVLLGTGARANF